jgi:hypothetical protein
MKLCRCLLRSEAWQEKKQGRDPWDQLGVGSRKVLPILGLRMLRLLVPPNLLKRDEYDMPDQR